MGKSQLIRLLFIDPHEEWLSFVKKTLTNSSYDVCTDQNFEFLYKIQEKGEELNLIFIDRNLAQKNIEFLNNLAHSFNLRLVVLFPGFPESKIARLFFKAGVQDSLSKPYDSISLKNMVEEQIAYASEHPRDLKKQRVNEDYESQVHRLWEFVRTGTLTRP